MNKLELSDDFINRIHAGLLELKALHAIPVIDEINKQLAAADDARKAAAIVETSPSS